MLVRASLLIPAALVVSAAMQSGARAQEPPSPRIGLWYTVWWTEADEYNHWSDCHVFPLRGIYDAGDPELIADHYAQFVDLGIDFLIMDDTNGWANDGGLIARNIEAWFDFMDDLPAEERIPICIGSGGEMRLMGADGQQQAADHYWDELAQRPSYFHLDGKPLLLVDTDKNYGPEDWDDERFTVRWAYNGDNTEAMVRNQAWGWGAFGTPPVLEESMPMWPGHRFHAWVIEQGRDVLEEPREGGRRYVRNWLHCLEAAPEFITIADWNNFQEETAIEDSYHWLDPMGYCVPNLYTRITRAYSRLRTGDLVEGEYYREKSSPHVYLYDGEELVHQGAQPKWATVILTPDGLLQARGAPEPEDQ